MTNGERDLCFFKKNMLGGFKTALFEAIFRADSRNKIKLSLGFPEEVLAVQKFQNEAGYWENLIKEFES
jgi:hypothetical protein